jgi:hypothetical protein
MSEERKKKGGATGPVVFVAIGLLIVLPVLYVLSVGPATWLFTRGYVSCKEGTPLWTFYTPLRWAARNSKVANDFLSWYENLFPPHPAEP